MKGQESAAPEASGYVPLPKVSPLWVSRTRERLVSCSFLSMMLYTLTSKAGDDIPSHARFGANQRSWFSAPFGVGLMGVVLESTSSARV